MLKKLNARVVLPYEQKLKSLKTEILKLNHTFDNKTIAEISAIVENAEMFLETSRERIELLESRDQEWDVAEESAKIQEMFKPLKHEEEKDEFVGKLLIEALKPAVTKEVKVKLSETSEKYLSKPTISYPTVKPGFPKINLNKSISEAKSLFHKMKHMKMLNKNNKQKNVDDEDELDKHQVDEQSEVAAVKKLKKSLELEALSDLKGREMIDDPVEHYSEGVKKALETAKEMSHQFMHEKMHNQNAYFEDEVPHPGFVHDYLAVLTLIGLVVVLGAAMGAFKVVFKRKKGSRVSMQNLSGVSDKSYLELQSIKEDNGWGRNFSPWSAYKNKQYKFK